MPQILPRSSWGAEHGQGYVTDGPKALAIVHHDGKNLILPRHGYNDEIAVMRRVERYHVNTNGWQGFGYNFAAMPYSGRIFEGRGWGRVGSHVPGFNSSSIGIFIPVDGDSYEPTTELLRSFHWLIAEGIRLGHLSPKVLVRGHQDFNKPACPGSLLYDNLVRTFVHTPVPTFRDFARAHPTLREGKGGAKAPVVEQNLVRLLQGKLRAQGLLANRHVTGYFGPITRAAVQAFQEKRGLTADGIVGPRTWAALGI